MEFTNGKKFNGSFEDFQKKLFSLKIDHQFIILIKEKIKIRVIEETKGSIKCEINDLTVDSFVKKFVKYIFTRKDNKKLKFSKFSKQNDNMFFIKYKTWFEKINLSISFQNINKDIYCTINCEDEDILNLVNDFFNFEDFKYSDTFAPHGMSTSHQGCVSADDWHKRRIIWKQWAQHPIKYTIFDFYNDWQTYWKL